MPFPAPYWQQPPPYGQAAPPWGQAAPPWGQAAPPWGQPAPWGAFPPRRPQRPGQVITAAVLAFIQALVVLIASLYLWFFASIADAAVAEAGESFSPTAVNALADEGVTLALLQLASVLVLIAAGIWALNSRRRPAGALLAAALAVQLVLAGYWAMRLTDEFGAAATDGSIGAFALFFAAGPLVGLGMLLIGPGRRWFDGTAPATRQA